VSSGSSATHGGTLMRPDTVRQRMETLGDLAKAGGRLAEADDCQTAQNTGLVPTVPSSAPRRNTPATDTAPNLKTALDRESRVR